MRKRYSTFASKRKGSCLIEIGIFSLFRMITARTDAAHCKKHGYYWHHLHKIVHYEELSWHCHSKQCTYCHAAGYRIILIYVPQMTQLRIQLQTLQTGPQQTLILFIEQLAKSTVNKGSDITRRSDGRLPPDRVLCPADRSIVIRIRIFHGINWFLRLTYSAGLASAISLKSSD